MSRKLSFGDELLKYWAILSAVGVLTFFGIVWGIRLEIKTNTAADMTIENDTRLDKLSRKVDKLETIEDLREKGQLCK